MKNKPNPGNIDFKHHTSNTWLFNSFSVNNYGKDG